MEEDFGRACLARMHVRMGSEKMNCSILECYIVGNVGLRRTLINLCFIFNKCQIFYLNTSRSMFQIFYFYLVLPLQKAPYTWDVNIYFYSSADTF